MAKINAQTLTITVSQLIKDSASNTALITDDSVSQIEAVIAALIAESSKDPVVIEVDLKTHK